MKYIRTKDGRILALNEFNYEKKYHRYRPNKKYLSRVGIGFSFWLWCFDDEYDSIPDVSGKLMIDIIKKEECKFADTIEELIDELVVHNPMNDGDFYPKYFVYLNKWENMLKPMSDYQKANGIEIYGAIWTDKGLTYVAKMNDKGEFELL